MTPKVLKLWEISKTSAHPTTAMHPHIAFLIPSCENAFARLGALQLVTITICVDMHGLGKRLHSLPCATYTMLVAS